MIIYDPQRICLDDWNSFLKSHSDATIYHTPEWMHFLESTFHFKTRYLFALNNSGELSGMLPIFQIPGIINNYRLCSTPFAHICGPIGQKEAQEELINTSIDLIRESRMNNFEIRYPVSSEKFLKINNFSTYILPLSKDVPEIWKRLDKGSVRWAISKAKRCDISVQATNNIDDFKIFYELNCITKKDLGVPCHPWIFFRNLHTYFEDKISLYIASYKKEIVGGGIMIRFKDSIIYGYGAANPNYLSYNPYNAFIWKSIEDACLNGYKFFDFGRSSYDNVGLIQFKKKWGTIEKKLIYSYYPNDVCLSNINRRGILYTTANQCFQKMPMSIYKQISGKIFGNFG